MSKRNVNAFSSSPLTRTAEFEQWRQWRGSSRKSLDKRSSVPTINKDLDHQQCFDFSTICICVFILFLLFLFLYFYYLYSFTCSWLRLFLPRVFDSSSFSRMMIIIIPQLLLFLILMILMMTMMMMTTVVFAANRAIIRSRRSHSCLYVGDYCNQ